MKIIVRPQEEHAESMREIEIMKSLNCENVIKYYDHFQKSAVKFFLIMEYCSVIQKNKFNSNRLKEAIFECELN